ncbi:MAG TPA: FAD-dependent oxidoreductase [Pseudonocardia sp.]
MVAEHRRSPDSVPPGKGLLVTFWAGDWSAERMERTDRESVEEMTASLTRLPPAVAGLVEFVAIGRWTPANPDLRPGHHRLDAELAATFDPRDRIALAGDYTGMPLIEACVISGRDVARRLATAINARD